MKALVGVYRSRNISFNRVLPIREWELNDEIDTLTHNSMYTWVFQQMYLCLWVVAFHPHVNSISNHWKLTFGKRSEVIHLHVDKQNPDFVLHCQWCSPFSPFLTSDIHQKLFIVAFWWISLSMSLDLICVALLLCLLVEMRSLSVNHPCCGTGVFYWNSLRLCRTLCLGFLQFPWARPCLDIHSHCAHISGCFV